MYLRYLRMNTPATTVGFALVVLTLIFTLNSISCGQAATPTNKQVAVSEKEKADAAVKKDTAAAQGAEKKAEPEEDFWHQEAMTGDWGGARSRWKEKGVELEFSFTNSFQGVASGGIETGSEYVGNFHTELKLDLGKLAGWNYWSVRIDTATRFGGPLLEGTGTINPVNTAAMVPAEEGTAFAFGTVSLTRLFPIDLKKGNLIAVSVGRFDTLDLVDEDFFGESGIQRFFNIAQNGPLTALRQIPLATNGATFAYVRHGEPIFTFAVLDPNDHSTDAGISDLFADGMSFVPTLNFPMKLFGKSAKHSFGGAITTKEYTPFDAIRQVIIPGPPLNPIEPKGGSWSLSYTFRQYIVERGPRDGWGLFTQFSIADEDTSPVTNFFNIGLGGNGLFKGRAKDEFGFVYAYTGLSDVLKDNIDILPFLNRRLKAEHQVEMFYNFHITPWLRLTGDLQIIRPTRPIAETAIVPGARLEVIF